MSEYPVPDDLKQLYASAKKLGRYNVGAWSDGFVASLIERIARAEAQLAAAHQTPTDEQIGNAMRAAGYDTAGEKAEIFWRVIRDYRARKGSPK